MNNTLFADINLGIRDGSIVPYLGPGVLRGLCGENSAERLPADSESLILAMNNGRLMAPKLMYEFPRAAMNQELKRGRKFVENFLTRIYGDHQWQRSKFHDWLAHLSPDYVIDINRDTQLQESYSNQPHTLIVGKARISASDYRFEIYHHDGTNYYSGKHALQSEPDHSHLPLPILFKPMGTPVPEPSYIASDADYVDYITELMGGFAIPSFVKHYRKNKQYVLLGMRLLRDTERMVLSDMIYASAEPAGWAFIPEPSAKERRFCTKRGIQIIEADWDALISLKPAIKTIPDEAPL